MTSQDTLILVGWPDMLRDLLEQKIDGKIKRPRVFRVIDVAVVDGNAGIKV